MDGVGSSQAVRGTNGHGDLGDANVQWMKNEPVDDPAPLIVFELDACPARFDQDLRQQES